MPGALPLYAPRLPASRICWRKYTASAGALMSASLRSRHFEGSVSGFDGHQRVDFCGANAPGFFCSPCGAYYARGSAPLHPAAPGLTYLLAQIHGLRRRSDERIASLQALRGEGLLRNQPTLETQNLTGGSVVMQV